MKGTGREVTKKFILEMLHGGPTFAFCTARALPLTVQKLTTKRVKHGIVLDRQYPGIDFPEDSRRLAFQPQPCVPGHNVPCR